MTRSTQPEQIVTEDPPRQLAHFTYFNVVWHVLSGRDIGE